MKAALYRQYGSPDVVHIEDIDKPVPKDSEVLIKIQAASVNPYDWHFMRGEPYPLRIVAGLGRPKNPRLGADVAGQVEAVGASVTQFKPGDNVFGTCRGAFAEYACTAGSTLARKPDSVSFEQAASIPIAALTALQALRDIGKLQPSQKVLINGAAGGVGTFAVQIAKSFGGEVTGVCSARNLEMVRSIGADRVIDYTREDFTRLGQRYDMILDCVSNHSLSEYRHILNPNGKYIGAGGSVGNWMLGAIARMIGALLLSRFVSQTFATVLAKPLQPDLITLSQLVASGKVTPVIDRRYKLAELPEAIHYLEQGHARGKVIITME